jgi:hypothetical protein
VRVSGLAPAASRSISRIDGVPDQSRQVGHPACANIFADLVQKRAEPAALREVSVNLSIPECIVALQNEGC